MLNTLKLINQYAMSKEKRTVKHIPYIYLRITTLILEQTFTDILVIIRFLRYGFRRVFNQKLQSLLSVLV